MIAVVMARVYSRRLNNQERGETPLRSAIPSALATARKTRVAG